MESILFAISFVVIGGLLTIGIAKLLRQSMAGVYVVIGFVLGVAAFALIESSVLRERFSTIGIAAVLLLAVHAIDAQRLQNSQKRGIAIGLIQIFLLLAAVYSITVIFGFAPDVDFSSSFVFVVAIAIAIIAIVSAFISLIKQSSQNPRSARIIRAVIIIASATGVWAFASIFPQSIPSRAIALCSLDIDVEVSPIDVDSYIAAQGGCDDLTVTSGGGNGTVTLQFFDNEIDIADGGIMTIDTGVTAVFDGALSYPSGDVVNDGTITHAPADTRGVSITAVNITNNGSIDVDEMGCQAILGSRGYGPDINTTECVLDGQGAANKPSTGGGAGASHGGYGGDSARDADDSYDSNFTPALLGASGASTSTHYAGHGGGLVTLSASGTFTNPGTVSANSEDALGSGGLYAASGGAGGSIYIIADIISGVGGIIRANGSDGATDTTSTAGGGGGGGRIALYYTTAGTYTAANLTAIGGEGGLKNTGIDQAGHGQNGSIVVVDSANDAYEIYSGFTFGISGENVGTVDNPLGSLTIDSTADEMHCDIGATDVDVYAADIQWDGSLNCSNGGITSFDIVASNSMVFGTGVDFLFSDRDVQLTFTSPSDLTFTDVVIQLGIGGWLNIVPYNSAQIGMTITGTSSIFANFESINLLTNFTLDPSATWTASGLGCPVSDIGENGYTPDADNLCAQALEGIGGGQSLGDGPGGGGYGGAGSDGDSGTGGAPYGSALRPTQLGSAGGNSGGNTESTFIAYGGNAGGGIMVQTPTISVAGAVSVNGDDGTVGTHLGNDGETGGGGSGGTIHFSAAQCSVSGGTYESFGGDGQTESKGQSGAGGGGRIRLACSDAANPLNAETVAAGGSGPIADGANGSANGDQLLVPTVAITAPYPDSYNNLLNPTLGALAYEANGGWPTADRQWIITDSDGAIVYSATTDPDTTSLTVSTDNGTFVGGATALAKETTYTLTVIDTNHRGEGSATLDFTTIYQDDTLSAANTYEWPFDTESNYTFNPTNVDLSGDSLAKLNDLGGGTYAAGSYTDVQVDASDLTTIANFWYTVSETLGGLHAGNIRYQIGNDSNGDNILEWYYVDYTGFEAAYDPLEIPTWTEAIGSPDVTNTSSQQQLDYYAPSWADTFSGEMTIRAYLISDGAQAVELDTTAVIVANYDEDADAFQDEADGGDDCDDTDNTINPDAEEIWYDGIDQNCDDADDYDQDGDGFILPEYIDRSDLPVGECSDTSKDTEPDENVDSNCAEPENPDTENPFVVDRVTGTKKGVGEVTVYAPDNSVYYTYEAFPKRGVYPVLLKYQGRYFVAAVQWKSGQFLKIHELQIDGAELQTKERISKTRKKRRIIFERLGSKKRPHVVISTTRGRDENGQKRKLKLIRFRPDFDQTVRTVKSHVYRVRSARKKIGNRVTIVNGHLVVILDAQGKALFVWNPKLQ